MSEEVVEKKKKKVKKPKSKARKIIEWVFLGIFMAICVVILAGQIEGMVNAKKHYGQTLRFGYATFVVKTDSMEPEMPVKSAIITKYESAASLYNNFTKKQQAGKTIDEIRLDITFMDVLRINGMHPSDTTHIYETNPTGYPMTHRVFEIQVRQDVKVGNGRFVFFASGINDQSQEWRKEQYQMFTEKEMLGTVKVRSTFLGGVFGVISSPIGLLIFLMIPAFYLVITSVMDIFKAYKEEDEPKEVTEGASSDGSGETTNQENGTENGEGNTDVLANLSEEERKRLKEELLQEMINKRGNNNE